LISALGLVFKHSYDNLDTLDESQITAPSGRTYRLIRHEHSPAPGTEILTSENGDIRTKLAEVLQELRLSDSDLLWVNPQIVLKDYSTELALRRLDEERQRIDQELAAIHKKLAQFRISPIQKRVFSELAKERQYISSQAKLKKTRRMVASQRKKASSTIKGRSAEKPKAVTKARRYSNDN